MSKVTILLAPDEMLGAFYLRTDNSVNDVRLSLKRYTPVKSFDVEQTGADAAEEAFDLTNNPGRQFEREQIYGRGRSVSTGDVVDVDGTKYVCMAFGWEKI